MWRVMRGNSKSLDLGNRWPEGKLSSYRGKPNKTEHGYSLFALL
jgi:hypothetical protein